MKGGRDFHSVLVRVLKRLGLSNRCFTNLSFIDEFFISNSNCCKFLLGNGLIGLQLSLPGEIAVIDIYMVFKVRAF